MAAVIPTKASSGGPFRSGSQCIAMYSGFTQFQVANAFICFAGFGTLAGYSPGHGMTFNQSWPVVYLTLTEQTFYFPTGATKTQVTSYTGNFQSGVFFPEIIGPTGSLDGGTDYTLVSLTDTAASYTFATSTGAPQNCTYTATLSTALSWSAQNTLGIALINSVGYPASPFYSIANSYRGPSGVTWTEAESQFGNLNSLQNSMAGACANGVPMKEIFQAPGVFALRPVPNGAAATINDQLAYNAKGFGSVTNSNPNNGAIWFQKSRWRLTGRRTNAGLAFSFNDPHLTLYRHNWSTSMSYPGFTSNGVASIGAQSLGVHTWDYSAAAQYEEWGFRSALI
ncbi:MAG TPA: hypothetical protein VG347_15115 [Verrucomicrobiae bacterium]|nr:hypothetical protein [Verrucomicrobiae bacterium]